MISVSYTGMVFIFCAIQLAGLYGLYWYISRKVLPAISNAKDQSMTDIRSLVPIIKAQEQELVTARTASLQARDYCADIKQEIINQSNKAGVA